MDYSAEFVGNRIKEERLKLNWSQETLGKELGQKSGAKQISKYESGNLPPLDVLLKLCSIFKCELGYLLGEENYSAGTKLDSAIESKLGLDTKSINSIKHITGTDSSCINRGLLSNEYRTVINKLISNPGFINLIESLRDLERRSIDYSNIFNELEIKHGKEIIDEAFEIYLDYHDIQLDDTTSEAIADIDSAIDELENISYSIKVLRYEARESFERLLFNIYSQKDL